MVEPMAMFTVLEKLDLTGKVVAPFCTNEGSGLGKSEDDLAKLCVGAKLVKGLSVHGAEINELEGAVAAWAKNVVQ